MITPTGFDELGFDRETLLGNFRALYRVDMELAQRLDDLADGGGLTVSAARTGDRTAAAMLDDGRKISLHSRYDPRAEATKFVDRLDLDTNFVFCVSGFGLGYQIRELFDRTSDQTAVVVFEPEPAVARAALSNLDFSEEISQQRLVIIDKADKGVLHQKLTRHSATMTLGTELAGHTYTNQWHAEFHRQMRTFVADYSAFCRMSFVTLVGNSRITQQNVSNNLWAYHGCPTTDQLKNRFAGYPAIVVSAGPSLNKNVHLLREAKGKAVIIAVQTTLKILLKLAVEPDFVTSLDYSPISSRFFEGIDDFGDIHLVAEPKVACEVPDTFAGRVSMLKNEFADLCLGSAGRKRIGMKAGSTVAHLAFYLAEFMGADPIILIGQDLGFGGNMYYSPGNVVHDMWGVELNRFCTLEGKEWERIVRSRPILRQVQDIEGRMIYTDEQMFTYLQQFERDFAECTAEVIDATQGGAKKLGATIMPLREALDRYARQQIDAKAFDLGHKGPWFDPGTLDEVAEQLRQRMGEADKLRDLCEKTVELLGQLEGLIDQPEKFNRLIVKVDQVRSKVNAHAKTLNMVCAVSALADLRRFRTDRTIGASQAVGGERARRQLARDREYVEAIRQGCDELKNVLGRAVERIDVKSLQAGVRS